ncbi:glycoside hydrolase family 13 domain protein [Gemmatirosa kalamazoonensis]|uniref:Glycoside hydrolase family 13 domain protein n=1 Tax=Gemmatirosa kalamazoonensis TaxID=861299 RepID=W0RMQ7_9BACT|nr:hypothetical protein [Gemmatirosa kalamazoonensis]AHG90698.1 glycoside hydrolase family 13 domain protein [Gemmatirosa kalamazoonensis]
MFDAHDDLETLPPSLTAALRRDVRPARGGGRDAAVAAIMDAVRDAPAPRRGHLRSRLLSLRPMRPRWALRRGTLSPAGAMLAACLTLAVGWLGALGGQRGIGMRPANREESVVRPSVIRDSLLDNAIVLAIRDTVRMVRFALEAPAASRVALVGDFTGWGARAVELRRRGGAWAADVPLRGGRHRFGFVVDDSQWVGAARAAARGFLADTLALAPARAVGDTI